MINTYYYVPSKRWGSRNFGDELVKPILHWVSGGEEVQRVHKKTHGKVLCIGSGLVSEGVVYPGDTIWGYGGNYPKPVTLPKDVKFLAVRGPKTRALYPEVIPEVYGDPGILMPLIYTPKKLEKTYRVGIIPHYIDKSLFKERKFMRDPSILLINVSQHWQDTIDQINACDMIISTSLHGVIVSEAYGKPTAWLKVSDRVLGKGYKFNDYLLGSGRDETEPNKYVHIWNILKSQPLPAAVHDRKGLIKAWQNQ